MRLINADALKEVICDNVYPVTDYFNSRDYGMFWTGGIEKAINEAPTIEAEPVRHGKWIRILDTRFGEKLNDIIGCSVCNIYYSSMDLIRRNYCPHCGAKMDQEESDEADL